MNGGSLPILERWPFLFMGPGQDVTAVLKSWRRSNEASSDLWAVSPAWRGGGGAGGGV